VYPGASFDRNYQPGTGNIAGQAPERGPLLITEEGLKQGGADHAAGRNVLIHELAHFFDRERRKSFAGYPHGHDGTWADYWTRQWRQHLQQGSVLPDYAGVNEAEFFAVACGMFFEQPGRLHAAHPELFERLREFFNQDPRRILF
jgi:Mlc titration factor MtfA (ptsG expression regulator)